MRYSLPVLVGVVVVASLAVVAILYARTDRYPNHRFASFERNFAPISIIPKDSFLLPLRGYYFAGSTPRTIFLAHYQHPAHTIAISQTLKDTSYFRLRVNTDSLLYRSIRVTVDSPYYYLADGTKRFIYRGRLGQIASPWIMDTPFSKAIPLSDYSAAMVAILNFRTTLMRQTISGSVPEQFPDLLQDQHEDLFSSDGMLLYAKASGQLVYVYFYRNEYVVMDTSFCEISRGHTIDTIRQAKIKTGHITSKSARVLSANALVVNNQSTLNNGLLYIHSNLLAQNEDVRVFESHAAVDVYSIKGGRYAYSFYLPMREKRMPKEFIVEGNIVLLLFDRLLLLCEIRMTEQLNNGRSEKDTIAQYP